MKADQREYFSKLSQCEHECDLCKPELMARREKDEQRRKEQSFLCKLKDILDPPLLLPLPTTAKHWHLFETNNSEARNHALNHFLASDANYYIEAPQYNNLLAKPTLFLCEDHLKIVTQKSPRKNNYCATCGEDYTLAESEHFGFRFSTGLPHISECRRCHQSSLAFPTVVVVITSFYKQYCVDCKKGTRYRKNEFGEAKPRFIIKNCSNCGGRYLQHVEVVSFAWSPKELLMREIAHDLESNSDPSECSYYHRNAAAAYCPICGEKLTSTQ